ncbi:MAG: hypothetical protein DME46_10700 [Verrucomicrobia bacterium]|nr:MAG: hypothetical protein DME46_10700 [Verrucomicrobiota bacterium]
MLDSLRFATQMSKLHGSSPTLRFPGACRFCCLILTAPLRETKLASLVYSTIRVMRMELSAAAKFRF